MTVCVRCRQAILATQKSAKGIDGNAHLVCLRK